MVWRHLGLIVMIKWVSTRGMADQVKIFASSLPVTLISFLLVGS